MVGLGTLVGIALATAIGPLVWTVDPLTQDVAARLRAPSGAHPLGTDQYGRDILARVLGGARWSLTGAAIVCAGTSLVGFAVGAVAATGGRLVDNVIGRLVESLMALPSLVLALALSAVLGPSFGNLLLALVAASWPWYARTYRSLVLKERGTLYVQAAVAIGADPVRVVTRHVLPNIVGPSIVIASAYFGAVILKLASLSFLGLGMQPPTPEWSMMINEARPFFQLHPWQMLMPGLCIAVTVLAINLSGDALRDLLDPRTTPT